MDIVDTFNHLIATEHLDDALFLGPNLESEVCDEFSVSHNVLEDSLKNMLSDKDPMLGSASSQFCLSALDSSDTDFHLPCTTALDDIMNEGDVKESGHDAMEEEEPLLPNRNRRCRTAKSLTPSPRKSPCVASQEPRRSLRQSTIARRSDTHTSVTKRSPAKSTPIKNEKALPEKQLELSPAREEQGDAQQEQGDAQQEPEKPSTLRRSTRRGRQTAQEMPVPASSPKKRATRATKKESMSELSGDSTVVPPVKKDEPSGLIETLVPADHCLVENVCVGDKKATVHIETECATEKPVSSAKFECTGTDDVDLLKTKAAENAPDLQSSEPSSLCTLNAMLLKPEEKSFETLNISCEVTECVDPVKVNEDNELVAALTGEHPECSSDSAQLEDNKKGHKDLLSESLSDSLTMRHVQLPAACEGSSISKVPQAEGSDTSSGKVEDNFISSVTDCKEDQKACDHTDKLPVEDDAGSKPADVKPGPKATKNTKSKEPKQKKSAEKNKLTPGVKKLAPGKRTVAQRKNMPGGSQSGLSPSESPRKGVKRKNIQSRGQTACSPPKTPKKALVIAKRKCSEVESLQLGVASEVEKTYLGPSVKVIVQGTKVRTILTESHSPQFKRKLVREHGQKVKTLPAQHSPYVKKTLTRDDVSQVKRTLIGVHGVHGKTVLTGDHGPQVRRILTGDHNPQVRPAENKQRVRKKLIKAKEFGPFPASKKLPMLGQKELQEQQYSKEIHSMVKHTSPQNKPLQQLGLKRLQPFPKRTSQHHDDAEEKGNEMAEELKEEDKKKLRQKKTKKGTQPRQRRSSAKNSSPISQQHEAVEEKDTEMPENLKEEDREALKQKKLEKGIQPRQRRSSAKSLSLFSQQQENVEEKDREMIEDLKDEDQERLRQKRLEKGIQPRQRRSSTKSLSLDDTPLFIPDNILSKKDGSEVHYYNDKDLWDHNKHCSFCRKPRISRFMVGCGRCDEWFHGDCVGLSLAQAQQMEQDDIEYICSKCSGEDKKARSVDHSAQDHHSKHQRHGEKAVEKPRMSSPIVGTGVKTGTNEKIKNTEDAAKHKVKIFKKEPSDGKSLTESKDLEGKKWHQVPERKAVQSAAVSHWPPEHKAVQPAPMSHRPPEHKAVQSPPASHRPPEHKAVQSPPASHRPPEHKAILSPPVSHRPPEESTEKLSKDTSPVSLPVEKTLKPGTGVEKHDVKKKKTEKASSATTPSPPANKPSVDQIRQSVRQSLKETLEKRIAETNMSLPEDRAGKVAGKIEKELFTFFKDTDLKYKNKYRSLSFNLKDAKNKVLFKRVLRGDITPDHLIRMSPEELASKELADWRQRENRHTIEMIEKEQREVERRPITKITHKGEIEIETDEQEKEQETAEVEESEPATVEKVEKVEVEVQVEEKVEITKDTTNQHKAHLFDLNCRICTGRMAPPADELCPKKVKVASAVARKPSDNDAENFEESLAEALSVANQLVMESTEEEDEDERLESPVRTPPSPESSQSSLERFERPGTAEDEATFLARLDLIWKGFLHMSSVAKFVTKAFPVSGSLDHLKEDLPDAIHVGGRISPQTVWDYVEKIRASGTKEICVVRFCPATEEDQIAYALLYAYFNSRKRYGVVANNMKQVKDMYLIPLGASEKVSHHLVPFDGPGLEMHRPNLLLGLIIRQRSKRQLSTGLTDEIQEEIFSTLASEKRSKKEDFKEDLLDTDDVDTDMEDTDNDENDFFNSVKTVLPKHRNRFQELEPDGSESTDSVGTETPKHSRAEPVKPLRFLPGVLLGWEGQPFSIDLASKPLPDDILQGLFDNSTDGIPEEVPVKESASDSEKTLPDKEVCLQEKNAASSEEPNTETVQSCVLGEPQKSSSITFKAEAEISSAVESPGSAGSLAGLSLKDKPPDVSTEAFLASISSVQMQAETKDSLEEIEPKDKPADTSVTVLSSCSVNTDGKNLDTTATENTSPKPARYLHIIKRKRDPRQAAVAVKSQKSSFQDNAHEKDSSEEKDDKQNEENQSQKVEEYAVSEREQAVLDHKHISGEQSQHFSQRDEDECSPVGHQKQNAQTLQVSDMDSSPTSLHNESGNFSDVTSKDTSCGPNSDVTFSALRSSQHSFHALKTSPMVHQFQGSVPPNFHPHNLPVHGFPPHLPLLPPPPVPPPVPPGFGYPRGPPMGLRPFDSVAQNHMAPWPPLVHMPGHPVLFSGPVGPEYPRGPEQSRLVDPHRFHQNKIDNLPERHHTDPWDRYDHTHTDRDFYRERGGHNRPKYYDDLHYQRKERDHEHDWSSENVREKSWDHDLERDRHRQRDRRSRDEMHRDRSGGEKGSEGRHSRDERSSERHGSKSRSEEHHHDRERDSEKREKHKHRDRDKDREKDKHSKSKDHDKRDHSDRSKSKR